MAAGMGSRMKIDFPKCLLQVDGKSLLEHQVTSLKDIGITDIYVVTGYKAEKFPDLSVNYVHNDKFAESGNAYSFHLALQECGTDDFVVVLDSDLMLDYRIYFDIEPNFQYFLDIYRDRHKGDIGVEIDINNRIIDFSRDLEYGVMVGLATYPPLFLQRLKGYFDTTTVPLQTELITIIRKLISNVKVNPCFVDYPWMEVDTPEDYEQAKQLFDNSEVEYSNDVTAEELMSLYHGCPDAGWLHIGRRSLERNEIIIRNSKWFVARVNGRVAGTIRYFSDGAYNAAVEDWMVRPEYRKGGIGVRLMLNMLESLRKEHVIKVVTIPSEHVQSLHEKLGWRWTRLPAMEIRYDYDRYSPNWKD